MSLAPMHEGAPTPPVAAVVRLTLLQALLNALLVPPLYVIAAWGDRWMPEEA